MNFVQIWLVWFVTLTWKLFFVGLFRVLTISTDVTATKLLKKYLIFKI